MSGSGNSEFDRYAGSYTRLHRDSIKASGEEPAYFARYKALYMARALGADRAARALAVLDFGCGIGNATAHLRAALPRASLHGVDPSAESIRLASERCGDDAEFRVSDERGLPYADGQFDLIQAACVFHHIPPPQRLRWMRELRRVLAPGGRLFVFEHNVLNPLTRKAVRDCPFDADAILLPRHELFGLAGGAGFSDIGARYIVFFPAALAGLRWLEPRLGRIPFGAQYVVHAVA